MQQHKRRCINTNCCCNISISSTPRRDNHATNIKQDPDVKPSRKHKYKHTRKGICFRPQQR